MEKNIWNAPYFQRRNWILENLENLHLDAGEAMVVLLIDYWNEQHVTVSQELIAKKLKMEEEQVEQIFDSLFQKDYVRIEMKGASIAFELDGLYELKGEEPQVQVSLIERFEYEMKRPLSPNEIQRILDMINRYDERRVVCALNEAVVYEKVNLNYIERILVTWMDKGLSVEDVENGKR